MDKEKYFEYLDDLRESGAVNVFGGAIYLQEEFGLLWEEAKAILVEWMQTFSERHSE